MLVPAACRVATAMALSLAVSSAVSAQTKPAPFTCAIQPDGVSVRVTISNPHANDAHCTAHCEFNTTKTDTKFIVECATSVGANASGKELCVKRFEAGRIVKLLEGKGECLNSAVPADEDEEDSDALVQKLQQQGKDFIDSTKKRP